MADILGIDQVLDDLGHMRDDLEMAADVLTGAETRLCTAQFYDLAQAQEDYELVIAMATMEAYANDVCSGKNQKQRDVQLAAYLGQHVEVKAAAEKLHGAKLKIALSEGELDVSRRNYSVVTNRLWALRAMAGLHAARLNAAAGVEYHTQKEAR